MSPPFKPPLAGFMRMQSSCSIMSLQDHRFVLGVYPFPVASKPASASSSAPLARSSGTLRLASPCCARGRQTFLDW